MKRTVIVAALCAVAPACSRENNLLEGRVEAKVGTHAVVVTDCYRTSVPPPQKLDQYTSPGHELYYFAPCRDAIITIHDEELVVNGTDYGKLKQGDSVTVDHGKVFVNDREPQPVASK